MSEPAVLLEADFDPKVKAYWIWQPVLILAIFIVTLPLAVIYALIANFVIDRYLENLRCTLTERTLDIKKGILNRVESTIPLEKITDLQLFQGPIMRFFGLHGFKVETAGQSSPTGGSLVNIVGIVDTKAFRKAVLEQRDRMALGAAAAPATRPADAASEDGSTIELLTEIRDSLQRIEQSLGR
ncbi:MAG: PH domain-containing protein [Acidobacteria bacterium]|nr:PH domain-containing protein [Acidobacteriota bacterium]NIM61417.1 PH domain-containing protein [Acidobacteriota bacterium]NIO59628.1 PH domain-containing protein [Acidobacteriota bacterium]NIQ30725.1 PH domain-containing protein [Acidobacteriota bacterium]NIQ85721.1 PH domain-containing protein [Acidobacteriota bacterium]